MAVDCLYPTLKSMNLLHRKANNNMLNGLWELLLYTIKSKDFFAESKHSVTLKPQLIQVCKYYSTQKCTSVNDNC